MILQLIPAEGIIQPGFELGREKTKNQIHCAANELRRRGAQSGGPRSLSAEIVLEPHVVCKGQPNVVDLEEVGDEVFFMIHSRCSLIKYNAECL